MTRRLAGPLRSMVAAGGLRIRVAGGCMEPRLVDGALVGVMPARIYWPGDVVAFVSEAGRLMAHRVIGYRPGRRGVRLWTQADAASRPDAPVAWPLVLGRIAAPVTLGERGLAVGRLVRHLLSRALGE